MRTTAETFDFGITPVVKRSHSSNRKQKRIAQRARLKRKTINTQKKEEITVSFAFVGFLNTLTNSIAVSHKKETQ